MVNGYGASEAGATSLEFVLNKLFYITAYIEPRATHVFNKSPNILIIYFLTFQNETMVYGLETQDPLLKLHVSDSKKRQVR